VTSGGCGVKRCKEATAFAGIGLYMRLEEAGNYGCIAMPTSFNQRLPGFRVVTALRVHIAGSHDLRAVLDTHVSFGLTRPRFSIPSGTRTKAVLV
jgi:hypothetical protein